MGIKRITLSSLEANLRETLDECAASCEAIVVELPGQRLIAIQSLDPTDDDTLVNDILESNPAFRELLAKSHASPRKPFQPQRDEG